MGLSSLSSPAATVQHGLLFLELVTALSGLRRDGGVFPVLLAPAVAACLPIGAIAFARGFQHKNLLLHVINFL